MFLFFFLCLNEEVSQAEEPAHWRAEIISSSASELNLPRGTWMGDEGRDVQGSCRFVSMVGACEPYDLFFFEICTGEAAPHQI